MKRIALWIVGRQIKKSADFLDRAAKVNPDSGVRLWAAARASSYRHILCWLRGEDELEGDSR
jgi:hypothetical protein